MLRSVCWLISPPGYCCRSLFLVAGFNPSEKYYSSQIGNLPQLGVKIKNLWNHHLSFFLGGSWFFSYILDPIFWGQNGHFARFPNPIHDPPESTRQVLGEQKECKNSWKNHKNTRNMAEPLLRLNMAEPSPLWKSEPSHQNPLRKRIWGFYGSPACCCMQFSGSPWNHDMTKDDEKIMVQVSNPTKRKDETKGDEGQQRHGGMDWSHGQCRGCQKTWKNGQWTKVCI